MSVKNNPYSLYDPNKPGANEALQLAIEKSGVRTNKNIQNIQRTASARTLHENKKLHNNGVGKAKPVDISNRGKVQKLAWNKVDNNLDLEKPVDDSFESALLEKYGEDLHKLSKSVAKLESNFAQCTHRYDSTSNLLKKTIRKNKTPRESSVVSPETSPTPRDLVYLGGGRNSKKTNSKSKKSIKRTPNRKRKSSYNKTHKRA